METKAAVLDSALREATVPLPMKLLFLALFTGIDLEAKSKLTGAFESYIALWSWPFSILRLIA